MEKTYVLRGGDSGAERLRLLAEVKWPTTRALLERVGLAPGMRFLDIGCGAGAVAAQIARWVGPSGRVVGLDADERSVELARQEAERVGLNVEFRTGSVMDLDETGEFDVVFARFVLTHVPEPEKALARMSRAVRPGGMVVVEDIEFAAHFSYPACPAFQRYVYLYQEAVKRKGADPNIGPRLVGMFLDAGLDEVEVDVVQPTYRQGPGKQIAQVTMEHIHESVVNEGLATQQEINDIVRELAAFADDPRTLMSLPRIFQVWGRRLPAS